MTSNGISPGTISREQDAADRGRVDHAAPSDPHLDAGVEVDLAGVVGDAHLVRAREALALAARARPLAGHVVAAEHDVLASAR